MKLLEKKNIECTVQPIFFVFVFVLSLSLFRFFPRTIRAIIKPIVLIVVKCCCSFYLFVVVVDFFFHFIRFLPMLCAMLYQIRAVYC